MSRNALQSSKYLEKKRKKIIGIISIFSFLLLVIVALSIFFLRAPFLQIKTIMVEGVSGLGENMKEVASSTLQGDYIRVIPKSNIFLYPKNTIKEALTSQFKEIADLSIGRSNFSTLIISVHERVPAALVCSGFYEDSSTDDQCYFSDDRGLIFGKVSTTSSPSSLNHYYVPTDQNDLLAGVSFINKDRFESLQKFLEGVVKAGLNPLGVLIADGGEYEMYIKPRTTIYFDDKSPFPTTLSNLITFWDNAHAKGKATSTASFDSVNLRFGNTIYYSR